MHQEPESWNKNKTSKKLEKRKEQNRGNWWRTLLPTWSIWTKDSTIFPCFYSRRSKFRRKNYSKSLISSENDGLVDQKQKWSNFASVQYVQKYDLSFVFGEMHQRPTNSLHKWRNRVDKLFWPDMSACHYRRIITSYLVAEKVDFVSKSENVPNVPQASGIERFWALCIQEYSRRSHAPKGPKGFQMVMGQIIGSVAAKSWKAVMQSAWGKLRKIVYKGVDEASII